MFKSVKDITTYLSTLNSLKKIYLANHIKEKIYRMYYFFNIINYCDIHKLSTYDYIKDKNARGRFILSKFDRKHRLRFLMEKQYFLLSHSTQLID